MATPLDCDGPKWKMKNASPRPDPANPMQSTAAEWLFEAEFYEKCANTSRAANDPEQAQYFEKKEREARELSARIESKTISQPETRDHEWERFGPVLLTVAALFLLYYIAKWVKGI